MSTTYDGTGLDRPAHPQGENGSLWTRESSRRLPGKSNVTNKDAGQRERAIPFGRVRDR